MRLQTVLNAVLSWTSLGTRPSPYQHHVDVNALGNLSPYHPSPSVAGVEAELPGDCSVEQVILLHRHGSRGPITGEDDLILGLVDTLDAAWDAIQEADLPPNLRFLKAGYKYDLEPEALSIMGRQQLFNHGVEFALRYPHISTTTVLSSPVERVIESARFFALGDLGPDIKDVYFMTVEDLDVPVNWILPWVACPNWNIELEPALEWSSHYIPQITDRLNSLLPGVYLSYDNAHGALLACPYDLAARNESPWCNVFLPHELRAFEYELDLGMSGMGAYLLPDNMGPLLGSVYVNKLIERLTNANGDAKELYLEFGHDVSILLILAAMGLNEDIPPLSGDHIRPHRRFRTSEQTPFAAQMIWEKFSCAKSFKGPQVRLLLNDATYPLSICEKSRMDKRYGTCSLHEFIKANSYSTGVQYGDAMWNASCGSA
ncbi:phosphoglycerate mutase-like protein [Phlebopus sp. FC_14]|nr:phosphoglycerate mutase-like protein [Phlebopus sp. FC_14]